MWDWELAGQVFVQLLGGFRITLLATGAGFAVALVVGLIWALARRSPVRAVALAAHGAVEFIRSTPLLVQLYFLYYVLPEVNLVLPALASGILGLGLHYSTYIAEIYRAGIEAVPRGQWEAASALGLSRRDIWWRIVLPQALPPLIPVLGNRLIALFKETPLLAAITVAEMLLVAREFGNTTFSYLEAYTGVGVLFLIASLISSAGVHWLERRYGGHDLQGI